MKILCVIPSRIGSTRLARKPLLPIQGKPMVQWVYENASRCKAFTKVMVATDSEEIASVIRSAGGEVRMTESALQTGSDRVAVVAKTETDMDIIVNLQGDEPFVTPAMLQGLVAPYLQGDTPAMTTLASPIEQTDMDNPGIVKVITNLKQEAIYFSRSPIPYFRYKGPAPVYHHMGVYAFRRDFLLQFTQWEKTPLELAESLEQLRAIEHGFPIRVCVTQGKTLEINTLEEYEQAKTFNIHEHL